MRRCFWLGRVTGRQTNLFCTVAGVFFVDVDFYPS